MVGCPTIALMCEECGLFFHGELYDDAGVVLHDQHCVHQIDLPVAVQVTDTQVQLLSDEIMAKIDAFEEYEDEKGKWVSLKDYLRTLRSEVESNKYYKMWVDTSNPDSAISQYNTWYEEYGPKLSM